MRTVSCSCALFMVLCCASQVLGQDRKPRVDVGLHYSLLSLEGLHETYHGAGFRVGVEIVRGVAADLELNGFYRETGYWDEFSMYRAQGLFGVKAGVRGNRAGLFAKCRPGFLYTGQWGYGYGTTQFALDLGGVVEVYPTRHLLLRFDVGDTMVRYPSAYDYRGHSWGGYMTHNLQFNAGIGWRF